MDTILTLFDACPNAGGVEMACNDDYASSVYTSEIQYDVMAGDVYHIGIDSWSIQSVRHLFFGYICTIRGQLQLIPEGYIFQANDGRHSLKMGDHLCRGDS